MIVRDVLRSSGQPLDAATGALMEPCIGHETAAAGPPNLNALDPLIKQVTPHVDRMKGAIDAAKGIAKVQPGVNVALAVGSGPRPGATPAEKPSGIFFGGAIVGTF